MIRHPPDLWLLPLPATPRFSPIDKRCGMALDDVDPASWDLLVTATQEYMQAQEQRLEELVDLLTGRQRPSAAKEGSDQAPTSSADGKEADDGSLGPSLGLRKGLLVLKAPRSAASGSPQGGGLHDTPYGTPNILLSDEILTELARMLGDMKHHVQTLDLAEAAASSTAGGEGRQLDGGGCRPSPSTSVVTRYVPAEPERWSRHVNDTASQASGTM